MEDIQKSTDQISKKVAKSHLTPLALVVAFIILLATGLAIIAKIATPTPIEKPAQSQSPDVTFIQKIAGNKTVTGYSIAASGKVTNIGNNTITISAGNDTLTIPYTQYTSFTKTIIPSIGNKNPPPSLVPFQKNLLHAGDMIQVRFLVVAGSSPQTVLITYIVPGSSVAPVSLKTTTVAAPLPPSQTRLSPKKQ